MFRPLCAIFERGKPATLLSTREGGDQGPPPWVSNAACLQRSPSAARSFSPLISMPGDKLFLVPWQEKLAWNRTYGQVFLHRLWFGFHN
ncbi:hypothetical protein RRG08_039270 [Elysia crispata]|uniref:Uncharacterized protein n=1 Tax=Elysia crispata TaxID=231223 RepID=A0AAE1DC82_9GAST|nr:hypothetical protein RRG08_039270 [Elysia crispata]